MTISPDLLQKLTHSPRLPLYVETLQNLLADEQTRRQHFYDEITEQQKAEFINGEIIVPSPVKLTHSTASQNLFKLLSTYVVCHQSGYVGHEKILISLTRNDYEPDICYFNADKAATFHPQQMKFPAPDLIVEVLSPSTAAIDRGVKFEDYAAHDVAEYWLIDPDEQIVEQYLLDGGIYQLHVRVTAEMTISSAILPDFQIPVRAIFDEQVQLAALRQLLI